MHVPPGAIAREKARDGSCASQMRCGEGRPAGCWRSMASKSVSISQGRDSIGTFGGQGRGGNGEFEIGKSCIGKSKSGELKLDEQTGKDLH